MLGYSRLSQTLPINGSTYNYNLSYDGSADIGYNMSARGSAYPGSKGSEMAYLYYIELGNKGAYDTSGNAHSGYGFVNKGPFTNIWQTYRPPAQYWSGTEIPVDPVTAWVFAFGGGNQGDIVKGDSGDNNALSVHSGDVGATSVPEPSSMLLLGSGLLGLLSYIFSEVIKSLLTIYTALW